jgi:hypothetical protein
MGAVWEPDGDIRVANDATLVMNVPFGGHMELCAPFRVEPYGTIKEADGTIWDLDVGLLGPIAPYGSQVRAI